LSRNLAPRIIKKDVIAKSDFRFYEKRRSRRRMKGKRKENKRGKNVNVVKSDGML
jgi:hypothetical protein